MNFKAVIKELNSLTNLINAFVIQEKCTFLYLKVQKEKLDY